MRRAFTVAATLLLASACDLGELDNAPGASGTDGDTDTDTDGLEPSAEELAGQYRGPGGCDDIDEQDNALTLDAAYAGRFYFVRAYSFDASTGMCVAPSEVCEWDVEVQVTESNRLNLTLSGDTLCTAASAECIYYESGVNCELSYFAGGEAADVTVDLHRV